MLARQAWLEVSCEGTNITENLKPYILTWGYTDNLDKLDDLSLTLRGDKFINEWSFKKGEKLKATIKVLNWKKEGDDRSLEAGEFSIDSDSFAGHPETTTVKAVSLDITKNLKNEKKNNAWENITLKKIAEEKTSQSGFSLVFESEDIEFERVEQTEESDLALLSRLANENGIQLKVINSQLVFFSETDYESKEASFIFDRLRGLKSFSFQSNDADTYDKCIIKYTDSALGETLEGSFSAPERAGYKEKTERVLEINESGDVPGETADAKISFLNKRAQKKLREKNKSETTGTIGVIGDPAYIAGLTCKIINFGKYDGKYIIEQVQHSGSGAYECSLKLRKTLEY